MANIALLHLTSYMHVSLCGTAFPSMFPNVPIVRVLPLNVSFTVGDMRYSSYWYQTPSKPSSINLDPEQAGVLSWQWSMVRCVNPVWTGLILGFL